MATGRRAPVRLSSLSGLERLLAPHGLQPRAPVQRRPFSLVFPAQQAGSGRELFVKLLVSKSAGVRRNFGREVEILRALEGRPGVKPLHVANIDDALTFHACEPVRGPSFVEIAGGDCDLAAVLGHARALASWIVALHRMGIAHRDLSPDHVFAEGGGLVVIDFGMAKQTQSLSIEERRLCEGYDVQALGMILWEMICQSAIFPYRGRGLRAVLERETALVREAELPDEVRRVLKGCFASESEATPDGLPPHRGFGSALEALRAFDG